VNLDPGSIKTLTLEGSGVMTDANSNASKLSHQEILDRIGMVIEKAEMGSERINTHRKSNGFKINLTVSASLTVSYIKLVMNLGEVIIHEVNRPRKKDPAKLQLKDIRLAIYSIAMDNVTPWSHSR